MIGTLTEVPWGVVYPDVDGPRHPVALYESAKNLVIAPLLFLALRRWPAGRGPVTALFVLLYGGLRFLVDLLRDYESSFLGLDTGQYFNLATAALGAALLGWALRRRGGATPTAAIARRPVGRVRPLAFAFLCLYPLGIPTSWTQAHIEQKRREETSRFDGGPAICAAGLPCRDGVRRTDTSTRSG